MELIEDLSDIGECYHEAEKLWREARDSHSQQDVAADEALERLKTSLDSLLEAIVEERSVRNHAYDDDEEEPMLEDPEAVAVKEKEASEGDQLAMEDAEELEKVEREILGDAYPKEEGTMVEFERPATAPEADVTVDLVESVEQKKKPAKKTHQVRTVCHLGDEKANECQSRFLLLYAIRQPAACA